jgi:glutamate racemase
MQPNPQPIGVFDSGVGGLSVLRALWPQASVLYVADSGHAPYGSKSAAQVRARSLAIAHWLHGQGAAALVVACNTATAHAVEALREAHPHWPLVGVEPGLKPALALSPSGRVAVLATPGTLASERYARLQRDHAEPAQAQVLALPCPGLAMAIERDDQPALQRQLDDIAQQLQQAGVDTVALGCTHYPFVAGELQARLGPGVLLVDTAQAIARRAQALAPQAWQGTGPGRLQLWTTGEPAALSHMARRWLGVEAPAQVLAV